MRALIDTYSTKSYELLDNYRSKELVVSLANSFVTSIGNRMQSSPLRAVQTESGSVHITKHRSANLEVPVVEDIMRNFRGGTACVLTAINKEALCVMGLLLRNNVSAKLIQTNNGFDLYNLAELCYFIKMLGNSNIPTISGSAWANAINALTTTYNKSVCLPICIMLLETFASFNKTKYRTDLVEFIHESSLNDFIENAQNTVLVSTMHKAKGCEFDQVYLMLNNCDITKDSAKRALYVAITRAIQDLHVHYRGNFMDGKPLSGVQYHQDMTIYPEPNEIVLQLGRRDVVLDFFKDKKARVLSLRIGEKLYPNGAYLLNEDDVVRQRVVKLVQSAQEQLELLMKKGYRVLRTEVGYVVAWKSDDDPKEDAIVLPTLYLGK